MTFYDFMLLFYKVAEKLKISAELSMSIFFGMLEELNTPKVQEQEQPKIID